MKLFKTLFLVALTLVMMSCDDDTSYTLEGKWISTTTTIEGDVTTKVVATILFDDGSLYSIEDITYTDDNMTYRETDYGSYTYSGSKLVLSSYSGGGMVDYTVVIGENSLSMTSYGVTKSYVPY